MKPIFGHKSAADTQCAPGELFLILGSSGYYEVSLSQGNAAKLVKCEPGAAIEFMVW